MVRSPISHLNVASNPLNFIHLISRPYWKALNESLSLGMLRRSPYFSYLGVILVIASSFWLIHDFGTSVPIADDWDLARILLRFHREGIDWATLTSFHAEHRQVLPRLYYFFVVSLAGWDPKLLMYLNVLPIACSAWLLVLTLSKRIASKALMLISSVVIGLMLGSWSQWQNFIWSFQFPWFFIPGCLVLANYVLLEHNSWRGQWLAMLVLFLATLCQANGFVTWIAIVPLWFFFSKAKRSKTLLLAFFCLGACLALFIAGHGSPRDPKETLMLVATRPLAFASWVLYLLGQPLTGCLTKSAGALRVGIGCADTAAVVILLPIVIAAIRTFRGRRVSTPLTLFACSLIIFGLVSALVFAVGRFSLGFELAAQSRYITHTQFVLLGCFFLVVEDIDRYWRDGGSVFRYVAATPICLLIAFVAVPYATTLSWLHDMRLAQARLKAALALSAIPSVQPELQGLTATLTVEEILSRSESLEVEGLMRPPKLAVDSLPESMVADRADGNALEGGVERRAVRNGRLEIEGWAVFAKRCRVPDAMVAVRNLKDGRFRIIAVSDAARIARSDMRKALGFRDALFSGWRISLPPAMPTADIRFFGFDSSSNRFYRLQ